MPGAEASQGSYSGELTALLRTRLAAVALIFSVAYAVLLVWHVIAWARHAPSVWLLLFGRFSWPRSSSACSSSPISLSLGWLRRLELALFGWSPPLLLVASQYTVNLAFVQHDDIPGMIAFIKNGVIQMVVMMLLYGTFIPNHPGRVAWAVLAMGARALFGVAVLTEHPDVAQVVAQLRSVEQTGSERPLSIDCSRDGDLRLVRLERAALQTSCTWPASLGLQYQLVRKLGEGGMGEVYLAEHRLLKRPCALKLIKPEAGSDPVAMARFEREVQSAARLSHPNTIEIFDYGLTGDGTFYYVMEYLQGTSLADMVRIHGPLPPGRVIYLFRQVCAGLAEAHGLGLVHRDLKPANLFVAVRGGESDVSKVLDFGLVKLTRDPAAASLTSDLSVSGTTLFHGRPEQAVGDRSPSMPGPTSTPCWRLHDVPRLDRPAAVHG